ncbi:Hypothetical 21.6 kDa protein F37A4.2 in chromosome III, putative [Brugia malayi]|uniref:Bm3883 n=1 Tax=Brugia malayi TaxID=6279 RepID=A0A0J9Y621_BRUMA|nr:putative 21.6 kDa protein F37A4.2 in chromosome III, putative [Brugia malayi]CDQ03108.2 Bm3883 [Brugia malayi]VIO92511.1 Hypothetical 21.6 kDa protein F37A4.2 in chromosome III, putative [Brugia malayi]
MPHEDKEQEEEQKARTAYDLMRMRLERLQKNIEKPVSIPQRRDGRKPRPPPDFVRNVVGSSAAAGSAEFHIFRNNRKREMDRLDYMNNKALQEELDEKFLAERRRRAEEEEKKTARKRLKRQRYKEKMKSLKKKNEKSGTESEADGDDSELSSTVENKDEISNQVTDKENNEVVQTDEVSTVPEKQSIGKAEIEKTDDSSSSTKRKKENT